MTGPAIVKMEYPKLDLPERNSVNTEMLVPPLDPEEAERSNR